MTTFLTALLLLAPAAAVVPASPQGVAGPVADSGADSGAAWEADWPDYRGPNYDGSAPGANLPTSWSETENVRWKTAIHGRGWSSPVVAEGRIWMTTGHPEGKELSVLGVDVESGEVLVDRVLFKPQEPEHRNSLNSYASPSPTLAPGRVFVHFGTYGTVCLDAKSGETLWQRTDLHCDHMEGPGSSPFYHRGKVVLHLDGGDVQYVVALDAETGETVWRTTRSADLEPLVPDFRKAYSTPIVVDVTTDAGEREELISSGATATYGYDPATGKELWRLDHPGFSMSSRPILAGDRVIVNTGFMRPELWAISPGGTGNVTETGRLWRNTKSAPTMPSPVVVGQHLFQISDSGMVSCVELETGESVWRERLGANHCASLLTSGGRIYAFGRDGKTTLFKAAGSFEKLGECQLDDSFMASPAVVGDALILRTTTHVYRIERAKGDK